MLTKGAVAVDVIYCDDSAPMEDYPKLTNEEKKRNEEFWNSMEKEFFKKDTNNGYEKIAV